MSVTQSMCLLHVIYDLIVYRFSYLVPENKGLDILFTQPDLHDLKKNRFLKICFICLLPITERSVTPYRPYNYNLLCPSKE